MIFPNLSLTLENATRNCKSKISVSNVKLSGGCNLLTLFDTSWPTRHISRGMPRTTQGGPNVKQVQCRCVFILWLVAPVVVWTVLASYWFFLFPGFPLYPFVTRGTLQEAWKHEGSIFIQHLERGTKCIYFPFGGKFQNPFDTLMAITFTSKDIGGGGHARYPLQRKPFWAHCFANWKHLAILCCGTPKWAPSVIATFWACPVSLILKTCAVSQMQIL